MSENYKKYIEEPRKLIETRNIAFRAALEGFISWEEFHEIEELVKKTLKEKYGYKVW